MKQHAKIFNRILIGVFIAVFTLQPMELYAAIDTQYYSSNDVLFYGEGGCKAVSAAAGTGENLVGNSNAEKIWNFLVGNDGNIPKADALTPEQAAGVMGNLRQESGPNFDPAINEGNGIGYGIAQWSFGRRTALEKAAKDQGVAVSDLGFQLSFMYQESKTRKVSRKVASQGYGQAGANEWATLRQQKTIEDAVVFWHNNFEVSADSPEFVIKQRGGFARDAYDSFSGQAAPEGGGVRVSGTAGKCTDDGQSFTGGDLAETTLAYAWPQYHDAPYTKKKPEYESAVKKAQSEGRYVGGLQYPGVDCGGFVTTLMVDSGFEPEYNYGGKFSKGAGNTVQQRAWAEANWQTLGSGSNINVADLQPGDVAFSPGHTFAYVGTIAGFDSKIASASVSFNGDGWRSPMAGKESPTSSSVTWFRKKV